MKRILGLAVLMLVALSSIGFCYEKHKCHDKLILAICKDKFKEPIEILYLFMDDMQTIYRITSNDVYIIRFNWARLMRQLKRDGFEVSDIMIIVHNHSPGATHDFTPRDVRAWETFKDNGFTGNFYLHMQGTNITYELREDEDDS